MNFLMLVRNMLPSDDIVCVAGFCLLISLLVGCGGGDGTTVIQPGADYQLNEQEKVNLELEEKMRRGEV